jgi:NAD(P)-dependent dehydrogenase (short-subunit alcohol dehydrogenase family)
VSQHFLYAAPVGTRLEGVHGLEQRCWITDVFAEVPVGRLGKPEESAETVLWMVRTSYVTKKIIAVDGGMVDR